jgi:hypothetical protein
VYPSVTRVCTRFLESVTFASPASQPSQPTSQPASPMPQPASQSAIPAPELASQVASPRSQPASQVVSQPVQLQSWLARQLVIVLSWAHCAQLGSLWGPEGGGAHVRPHPSPPRTPHCVLLSTQDHSMDAYIMCVCSWSKKFVSNHGSWRSNQQSDEHHL